MSDGVFIGSDFDILGCGLFSRAAVTVEYRRTAAIRDPEAEAWIDRAWQEYVRASRDIGITLYNGALFRLDSFQVSDGRLHLMLSDDDFRSCIGTATPEFASAFPDAPRANPLSVSVVLITADKKIVIEKRNRVDVRRRKYHVIAGYMERERDELTSGDVHPFDTLQREVREELGIEIDDSALSATGLVRAVYGSELCFLCRLAVSFEDLLEMQTGHKTDCEIEALEALDDSPAAVAAFLTRRPGDIVPNGRACLLFYGREAYGAEWYGRLRGR